MIGQMLMMRINPLTLIYNPTKSAATCNKRVATLLIPLCKEVGSLAR